ncbi:MAG: heavy-metal-associated domain-containing protein [Actinobacteria bacterium]|nr:heavy-metal-associated domain-containing protein [Actinomycetota bacterium]
MTTTTYQVTGMTCDHCVRAVTTELVLLDGVRSVDVDLAQGVVTVTSDGPLDVEDVREAIDEAGYALEG